MVFPFVIARGVSGGLFWCYKRDFDAIGGFDESLVSVEDLDFAVRLKRHGRRTGRVFGTLQRDFIWTSCRKFDQFGDWYLIRNPRLVFAIFSGRDRAAANRFYYHTRDKTAWQIPKRQPIRCAVDRLRELEPHACRPRFALGPGLEHQATFQLVITDSWMCLRGMIRRASACNRELLKSYLHATFRVEIDESYWSFYLKRVDSY